MFRGLGIQGTGCALTVVIALTLTLPCTRGETLLHDTFSYPDGPLVTQSSLWLAHSGTAMETPVNGGALLLSSQRTEDVSALLPGHPFDAHAATNRLYSSVRLRVVQLPSSSGGYFAHLKGAGGSSFAARIWLLPGPNESTVRIGLSSTNGAAPEAIWPVPLSTNAGHLIVTRLVTTNTATKLWVNPTAETDAHITAGTVPDTSTISAYAFRQASGIGSVAIDELRVGTTFSDVAPGAAPFFAPCIQIAPQHQWTAAGGVATFTVGVDGDPAPSIQWFRNGVALQDANGGSLTLSNAGFGDAGFYHASVSNAIDTAFTMPVALNIRVVRNPAFSVLNFNLHGNGALNWTTNSPHVQAIGRIVLHLNADILTLQEIPVTNGGTAQMENFVKAYCPGFHLATNSSDDGQIRSAILSRYPIAASRSWLHDADLSVFGYEGGRFKRDLFEAEIAVPGLAQSIHVFTVHLKSGQGASESAHRAAEAAAISNFLAAAFLPKHPNALYLLSGDFNEDVMRPPANGPRAVNNLVNPATGLRLATPFNAATLSELTFSMQAAALARRYDYILPSSVLWSNLVAAGVFRSDKADASSVGLLQDDSERASDHLPVYMQFANPWEVPRVLAVSVHNEALVIRATWEPGESLQLERSSDLRNWNAIEAPAVVEKGTVNWTLPVTNAHEFIRVRMQVDD